MRKEGWMAGVLLGLAVAACGRGGDEATWPEAVREGTPYALAGVFRTEPAQVRLVQVEEVVWPDGCLGIPMREACGAAEVPGYRFLVEVEGRRYEYRASRADPLALTLAESPGPVVEDPVLIWEAYEGRCVGLRLSAEGLGGAGYCDAPYLALPLLEVRRHRREWEALLDRFAPFRYEGPGEKLIFEGRGTEAASPAWQRAVAAWSTVVYAEQTSGRSGASWATVAAWQRTLPPPAGTCDFLTVEGYGYAFASRAACGGGDASNLGEGWLDDAAWRTFDRWHTAYAPVDRGGVHFFGRGEQTMPADTVAAFDRWAAAAFARLAGSGG